MIYNFLEYLRETFSGLVTSPDTQITTTIDGLEDEIVWINDTGGSHDGYPDNRSDATIQIVCYARTDFRARELCDSIFQTLHDIHDIILPAASGSDSPAPNTLRIQRINAIQRPYNFGPDEKGFIRYSNNYIITFAEGALVN